MGIRYSCWAGQHSVCWAGQQAACWICWRAQHSRRSITYNTSLCLSALSSLLLSLYCQMIRFFRMISWKSMKPILTTKNWPPKIYFEANTVQQKMGVAQQINYTQPTCWANYTQPTLLGQHFAGPTLLAQHVGPAVGPTCWRPTKLYPQPKYETY